MNRCVAAWLTLGSIWFAIGIAGASQVRTVNLEEMTDRASTIFSGRCIDVATVSDPVLGRDVSVARFEVHHAVKGAAEGIVTVRMAADDQGTASGGDVPSFQKGEEVVLFLYGESSLGLRAPVGLGQGRFRVFSDKKGHVLAMNDLGNRNLLRALSPAAQERIARTSEFRADGDELGPGDLLALAEALAEPGR